MVTPPSIVTDSTGRTVVVKAGIDALADRRRHEAEILDRCRHPGVVELLSVIDAGERVELQLDHVAAPPLALHAPLPASALARIGAAVAETMADMHDAGVAHRHVAADHVLVPDDGRVVLCGLADADLADADTIRADIVALGEVLLRQLDRAADAGVDGATGAAADELRRLLTEAVADIGLQRSARALAGRLAELAESAAAPERQQRWFGVPRPARIDGRLVVAAALVVVLTAAAVGLIAVRSAGDGAVSVSPVPTATETASRSQGVPLTTTATGTSAVTGSNPSPAPRESAAPPASLVLSAPTECEPVAEGWSAADIDGDGCPDPWRFLDGVLELEAIRFAVGSAEDLVAVGDWDCDGTSTPALVETASGGIFLFPSWAADDAGLTVEAVGRVDDVVAAATVRGPDCDVLDVSGRDGSTRFGGQP